MSFQMPPFRSISFITRTWQAGCEDDGSLGPLLRGQKLLVRAARPARLRVEAQPITDELQPVEQFVCNPFDFFVCNGGRTCEVARASHIFVTSDAARSLAEMTGERGLPTLVLPEIVFTEGPLAEFEGGGDAISAGIDARTYARRHTEEDTTWEQRIYADRATGLPLRVVVLLQQGSERPQKVARVEYSDWELNPELPDALFDTTPPADAIPKPPSQPPYDPALAAGGEPRPIHVVSLAGLPITLERFQGQVLLLHYWATWCGPCRMEMPHLVELYERYHERGLEIVSISLDERDRRRELLQMIEAHRLPWPQVCDGLGFESPLARRYQLHAIPFLLLIGRDGKIAAVDPRGPELAPAIEAALSG